MNHKPLTIFVDGIWRRPGRFRHWRRLLSNYGIESEEWQYDSSGFVPIDRLAERLAADIRLHNSAVNMLGFSMGGLIVREARRLDPTLPIQRAAFLNTPHHGTWMAWTLPLPAIRQMRPRSAFLHQLNAASWNIPTIAVYCPGDVMVLPGTRARFADASESICSPVPAHMWPVHSPRIRRSVVKFLAGAISPSVEAERATA
jgi:triacylglycerol lipase